MFSSSDIKQIERLGINLEQVEYQLQKFRQGFPSLPIERAATLDDGLIKFDDQQIQELVTEFDQEASGLRLCKFVPASGAASRMFKSLMNFLNDFNPENPEIHSDPLISRFFAEIKDFAFYSDLDHALARSGGIDRLISRHEYDVVVKGLLEDLGYASLPKGLLAFHRYPDHVRTAVEEHLIEGAAYARGGDGQVFLHFTVSPEHKTAFEDLLKRVQVRYERLFEVEYDISFSEQRSSTNTIAVDLDNQPFRLDSGQLLFRPGGHGALLANLNDLDADLVFIKNVDNVVPDRLKAETYLHKKVIGGLLLKTQSMVFDYQQKLGESPSESLVLEALEFLESSLKIILPEGWKNLPIPELREVVIRKLNRPIRVCGIVENTGEAGGGPFWTRNSDGSVSLQIGETAQIDMSDPKAKEIFMSSTHFSPTDIVCGMKNYRGEKFDLMQHVDHQTGFIARKSQGGRDLKALELPGLWNGSMSDWNTLFVEVPLITFNPVKVVNDLLRPEHQA